MLKEMLRSTINSHFSYVILCFSKIFGELFGIQGTQVRRQQLNELIIFILPTQTNFKLKNSLSRTRSFVKQNDIDFAH